MTLHTVRRLVVLIGIALLAARCTVKPPPVVPAPVSPAVIAAWTATCQALWQEELQRPIDDAGLAGCLAAARAGGTADQQRAVLRGSAEYVALHAHVDPSTIPLETLAAIRGAMWTARLNLPYGPRPGQDSNILAMTFYGLYSPADQARMLAHYHDDLGYTHAVTGPVTGNDCYHGLYPCRQGIPTQAEWDAYLDELQTWWDHGITPVYFAKPDGWERAEFAASMDTLDALYAQPRAQRLLRVVVYPGWEPSGDKYGWSNATYVTWVQRGARVFPHALRLLHTVSDLDAPTGGDDDRTFPAGQGNRLAWRNVAPYIHGWLVQVGGYVGGSGPTPTPFFLSEFSKLFADLHHKFAGDAAGWPTTSAWGQQPLRVYYAEGASYGDFWHDWPEATARDLGDRAMRAGADGYLDGGNVSVPAR